MLILPLAAELLFSACKQMKTLNDDDDDDDAVVVVVIVTVVQCLHFK
jgi:hypothetical protein